MFPNVITVALKNTFVKSRFPGSKTRAFAYIRAAATVPVESTEYHGSAFNDTALVAAHPWNRIPGCRSRAELFHDAVDLGHRVIVVQRLEPAADPRHGPAGMPATDRHGPDRGRDGIGARSPPDR